jgi:hypothetical protein
MGWMFYCYLLSNLDKVNATLEKTLAFYLFTFDESF